MRRIRNSKTTNVHIGVKNFGPVEKAEIDLRPLTVFVGESNSGKTYLSALIYALHHTFEGFPRFPWSISSIFYGLRHYYFGSHLSSPIGIKLKPEKNEEFLNTLEKLNNVKQPFKFSDLPQYMCSQLELGLKDSTVLKEELKRCFDLESISNLAKFTRNKSSRLSISLKVCDGKQNIWNFDMYCSGSKITVDGSANQDLVILSGSKKKLQETLGVEELMVYLDSTTFRGRAGNSYYLPAARSGIMQSHGVIASSLVERATRIGLERFPEITTFSGMIADFLKFIINYKDRKRTSNQIIKIAEKLEKDVLGGEIKISRPSPSAYPEFLYHPQKSNRDLRMNQSSSMVSELTPLVLFLRGIVKRGDTLIIEEPESHLHPGAQTQIAITLARLVRAGVRVIITTHSDWLLQQIGNLIREGELNKQEQDTSELPHWLSKEEVGAWWFHTDKPVQEIPYDRIEGIEPKDYEDVADGLYNNFVELERQFLKEEAVSEDE